MLPPLGTKGALPYRVKPCSAPCETGSPDSECPGCYSVPFKRAAPLAASPAPAGFLPQAAVKDVIVQEDVLFFSAPAGEIRYKFPFAVDNIFQM